MKTRIRIAVTGGAGQIAYSLLFRLAQGELFPGQPIALHILEVKEALPQVEGVVMELRDCSFPLLAEIRSGDDPYTLFEQVDFAFLVGAKPRGPGMERKELLSENGAIFVGQGKALAASASKNVCVLVVGNPCNTNCLIALHNAKGLSPKQFHAMTRLDQNRAQALLAQKSTTAVTAVSNVTIWGNHSSTQVPDFVHAKIDGFPVQDCIQDRVWLEKDFIKQVQNRGAEIIKARGRSSAASAASAAIDAMKAFHTQTRSGDWYSSGEYAEANAYGIDPDLVFSFPCVTVKDRVQVIEGLTWNPFLEERIKASEKELLEERDLVKELLR